MKNHFRTAVLSIILAGGTLASYATAYAMMGETSQNSSVAALSGSSRVRVSNKVAQRLLSGQTDVSVREACSDNEGFQARGQCMQSIAAGPRPIRVIDFASSNETLIR